MLFYLLYISGNKSQESGSVPDHLGTFRFILNNTSWVSKNDTNEHFTPS